MTADIINLRRARKAKARVEKDASAAENRTRFGRTKAEKQLVAAESRLAERRIEGHRLPSTTTNAPASSASAPDSKDEA